MMNYILRYQGYYHRYHNSSCLSCINSAQCTIIPRLSKQHGFLTWYMDVQQDAGLLAVSGYKGKANDGVSGFKDRKKDTFVHLFKINNFERDSQGNMLLLTYSKEFPSAGTWQRVCILDDTDYILSCDNKIELYDIKKGRIKQCEFTGEAACITTRQKNIYVGLFSRMVVVFDLNLDQKDTITLRGLDIGDCPWDMTVANDKLFITTNSSKAFIFNRNGDTEHQYKNPNQQYILAWSITVSEMNGLLYILWGDNNYLGKRVILVYSLPGINSSLFGAHFLASFNVPDGSCRIRINDNLKRLFLVTWDTERVYAYHTSNLFNFENLLTTLELSIEEDDCQKILNYFKVSDVKATIIFESDSPSKSLLQHLTETGKASGDDVSHLMKACYDQGIGKVVEILTDYQHVQYQKQLTQQLHKSEYQMKLLLDQLTKSENERKQIASRLKETQLGKLDLTATMAAAEVQQQKVTDQLTKLTNILRAREEEQTQLLRSNKVSVSIDERDISTGLDATDGETRPACKVKLKQTEDEKQQYVNTPMATEKDQQLLNCVNDERPTTMVDENQVEMCNHEKVPNLKAAKEEPVKFQVEHANTMDLHRILKQTIETLNEKEIELEETKSALSSTKDELLISRLALEEVVKVTEEVVNENEKISLGYVDKGESLPEETHSSRLSLESGLTDKTVESAMDGATSMLVGSEGRELLDESEHQYDHERLIKRQSQSMPSPQLAQQHQNQHILASHPTQDSHGYCIPTPQMTQHYQDQRIPAYPESKNDQRQSRPTYQVTQHFQGQNIPASQQTRYYQAQDVFTTQMTQHPQEQNITGYAIGGRYMGQSMPLSQVNEQYQIKMLPELEETIDFHGNNMSMPTFELFQDHSVQGIPSYQQTQDFQRLRILSSEVTLQHQGKDMPEQMVQYYNASPSLTIDKGGTSTPSAATAPSKTEVSQLQKANNEQSSASGKVENLNRQVEETILWDLSEQFSKEWKVVGRGLQIKETSLDHLDERYQSREKNYQMLLTWRRANGSNATYRVLGEAFRAATRKDLQEYVYKKVEKLLS